MTTYEYILEVRDKATMAMRRVQSQGSTTYTQLQQQQERLNRATEAYGGLLTRVFSGYMIYQGGKAIWTLGTNMEQTRISMEVFTKSASTANKMIGDLQKWGDISPLTDVAIMNSAKLLMGFNVSAKDTVPAIKMLGDIAGANEEKFGLLSLAYAQSMSAGKLMGQDLLQMISARFNPLLEISKRTGKSMADLRKDMEKGAISAEMVTQAFKDATSEGGRFYNMTARQAQTVGGLWSTALSGMQRSAIKLFDTIKPELTKLVKSLIGLTNWLQTNMDTVIRFTPAIVSLAGAFWLLPKAIRAIQFSWAGLVNMLKKDPYTLLAASMIYFVMKNKQYWDQFKTTVVGQVDAANRAIDTYLERVDKAINKAGKLSYTGYLAERVKIQGEIISLAKQMKDANKVPDTYKEPKYLIPSLKWGWIGNDKKLGQSQFGMIRDQFDFARKQLNELDNQYAGMFDNTGGGGGADNPYKKWLDGISDNSKPQIVTINIGKLNEKIEVVSQTFAGGVSEVETRLTEMMLRAVNSANRLR